jgi:hypothetical protein
MPAYYNRLFFIGKEEVLIREAYWYKISLGGQVIECARETFNLGAKGL